MCGASLCNASLCGRPHPGMIGRERNSLGAFAAVLRPEGGERLLRRGVPRRADRQVTLAVVPGLAVRVRVARPGADRDLRTERRIWGAEAPDRLLLIEGAQRVHRRLGHL